MIKQFKGKYPKVNRWFYKYGEEPFLLQTDDESEAEQMIKDGWGDTPALLKEPVKAEVEQVAEPDEDTPAELVALISMFEDDPESLNKDEHIVLGKFYGLKLSKSMKEETMISKIQEKLNANNETDS